MALIFPLIVPSVAEIMSEEITPVAVSYVIPVPAEIAVLALALVKYTLPVVVVPDSIIFAVYNLTSPVNPLTFVTGKSIATFPADEIIPFAPIINAATDAFVPYSPAVTPLSGIAAPTSAD